MSYPQNVMFCGFFYIRLFDLNTIKIYNLDMKNFIKNINFVDILLVSITIIGSVVASLILQEFKILPILMNLISVLAVLLAAKGNYLYTIFSIIYNSIYVFISFVSGIFGDAVVTLVYYIPMLIYTAIFWKKNHSQNNKTEVAVKTLTKKHWAIVLLCTIIVFAISCLILYWVGSQYVIVDALTTALFIVSSYIGARAFAEQWIFWMVLNFFETIMWIVVSSSALTYDSILTAIMLFVHLINSIYALINWYKMRKNQDLLEK